MSCFSFAAFKFFFVFDFWEFDYNMSQWRPWCPVFGILWSSWIWMFIALCKYRKFFDIISLKKLSATSLFSVPSGIPIMHILVFLLLSHRSCRLSSLLFILFLPLIGCFNLLIFELADSFFCIIKSIDEALYWIFGLVIIQLQDFFSVFFTVSIFLNFSFCSCIVFLALFSCLCSLVAHCSSWALIAHDYFQYFVSSSWLSIL